ncbi:MAG: SDR family oxidoreductase [Planctomycetota bacterium]
MKRVLVTGARGFLGLPLCRHLASVGWSIRAAVRYPDRFMEELLDVTPDKEVISIGEIGPETDWSRPLKGVDAVAHLAARVHQMRDSAPDPPSAYRVVNVEATRRLAQEAARSGVKRFLFLSTAKVHGEGNVSRPFMESDPPAPEDPYARSKWEAEQVLRRIEKEQGLPVVIVRPPLVYGPRVKGNLLSVLRWVKRGVPLPLGSIQNRRSLVGLTNLLDFLALCLDHPKAPGETFLISDREDLSTAELFEKIGKGLHVKSRLIPFPVKVLHALATLVGKRDLAQRLCNSLVVDSSKARRLLSWNPPCSMNQEIQRMCDWFLEDATKEKE